MILKNYEELAEVRERHKNQSIVICAGTFDLTHAGHVLFFEDCKKLGDILVVVIGNDYDCRRYKGDKRPILNENLRMFMVNSLRPVDYVILQKVDPVHLLGSYDELFNIFRPNVYVCNKDIKSEKFKDAADTDYREQIAKKYGAQFILLDRRCPPEFEDVSTTKIIHKIIDLNKTDPA